MNRQKSKKLLATFVAMAAVLVISACSSPGDTPTLVIGGIPDQDVSLLEERFDGIASILSDELGFEVEYRPSVTYAAVVSAFRQGDIGLGWFGGLTGVQARLADPGSRAILQRPRDEEFRSVFVIGAGVDAQSLSDLKGLSFTFGSESSTSGHLMPRYFLTEAGVDPDADFDGRPSYSGSHDKTWKQVEAGAFQAGALNEAVWARAIERDQVDLSRVQALETTPEYYDYHWVAGSRINETYGEGTVDKIRDVLASLSPADQSVMSTLDLFHTDRFIPTNDSNYEAIEMTARQLGLIN